MHNSARYIINNDGVDVEESYKYKEYVSQSYFYSTKIQLMLIILFSSLLKIMF